MQVGHLLILSGLFISGLGKCSLTSKYRLSKDIIPELYDIHIKPYLRLKDAEKQFTFDGQVNITLRTSVYRIMKITLHKKFITIINSSLFDANEHLVQEINSENMLHDPNTDQLQINLATPLTVGKSYILNFNYRGQIRNGTDGFHRATSDGVIWYGLTQLHAVDARTVFPCFDEPEFKARFRMHISRTHDYNSFFNTLLSNSTVEGERIIDHFEETPLMSTYLVAFLQSNHKCQGNENLKIIMDAKFSEKTNFAFEVGLKAIDAFNNYTQFPYKSLGNAIMQMVATNYFPYSGMENWGLVLYKESALTQQPDYTDGWSDKQNAISLIFHETAHMWFGNTVTHKWWSYFWLNEAFPNYYQYFIANKFYPEYEFDQQFLVEELHPILEWDATNNTQPMTSAEEIINTPREISSKLNKIAYSKGASVVRMFRNLMGSENFDMAIRAYLKENYLKAVTPNDLFKQLKIYWPSEHIVDLEEFFKDWTEQVGYPLVNISVSACGRFSVKQQRFLLDANDGSNDSLKYNIPITYNSDKLKNGQNLTPQFYLSKKEDERLFSNASEHQWVIINNQQSNYYRVFYDSQLLRQLKNAFMLDSHSNIHVNNRASIIDDLFAYAQIGLRGYDEVFDFIEYLTTEMEYLPWKAAFKGFQNIYPHLTLAQHYKFGQYLVELLHKVYQKLGFENDNNTILDLYNRKNIIKWLCKYNHDNCNAQSQDILKQHFSAKSKPNSDFRETLYCAAVRNDNSFIYETLREMFLKQQLTSEKEKMLRAMGCTRHFVHHHFDFLLTDNVTEAFKAIGLKSLYVQTPENIIPVFKLILENTQQLTEAFQNGSSTALLIKDIAEYLTTQEELSLLKQFMQDKGHIFGPAVTHLKSSIQIVENNFKWSSQHLDKLMAYLTKRKTNYRLTKNVTPKLYDMHLKPYLRPEDGDKQFTMDGEVNITIQANKDRLKEIKLHKNKLLILEVILYDIKGQILENISSGSMLEETLTNTFTIVLLRPLELHMTYVLYFKYRGQISSGLSGFFRSTYDNVNWYGISQLQRINARTVFPCFDEPQFKAKFLMHISRPKSYNSAFNTRLLKTTTDGADNCVDHFAETPLMSTYLIAFLISEFETQGNDEFKLFVHPTFANKTGFAYETGLRILAAFDNYTKLPYKTLGNSIMQLAASSHFPHNGMENWGLVLYKHPVLVHEPGYTDGWSDKEYTVTIMTHETSHMWFGNSVTFKWWSHFWLNEGFARYYQYFMAHQLYPEFELDKQFVVKQIQNIFETDATNNTQPLTSLEKTINTPSEIAYKFSGITYAKGAVIVRMFSNLMGQERFVQAVREYLKENHLKNVVPQNLFKYLKKFWPPEHQVCLDTFFKDWTEQVGYPVVTVSLNSNGTYILRQKRFLIDCNDGCANSLRYTIPITYNSNTKADYNDFTPSLYFNKTLEEVELANDGHNDDWILVNTQQSNYYRVFYESNLTAKLLKAFRNQNHSKIHVNNRASIIDDLFAFARTGLKGYNEVFEFMEYLNTEAEYTPWYAAFKGFLWLSKHLTIEQHKLFGRFLYGVLDNVYNKVGFQNANDTVLDIYNRNNIISWLCKYHHADCNTQAQKLFRTHMSAHTKPTADFREVLYCAACRNGDSAIYEHVKEMFRNEELPAEAEKILRAMACTRHNVQHHYEFLLSPSVPHHLKVSGLSSLYTQTPENIMTVFRLMIGNVQRLEQALQDWHTTATVISEISAYLTTNEQLQMLKQFIQRHDHLFGMHSAVLEKCVKSTEIKLKWANTHLKELSRYLVPHNGIKSFAIDL